MTKRHYNTSSLEVVSEKILEVSDGLYTAPFLDEEYVNGRSKVTVHCSKHGVEWKAGIENLYRGRGCPQCAKEKQKAKLRVAPADKIVEIESKVGEGKYDFSRINLDGDIQDKVWIKCKHHEEWFENQLSKLIRAKGCKKCVHESRMINYNKRTEGAVENLPYKLLTDSWKNVKRKSTKYDLMYPVQCKNCDHVFEANWQAIFGSSMHICVVCSNGIVQTTEDFKAKVAYKRDPEKPSYNLDQFEYTGYDQPSKVICEKHGFCQNMSARSVIDSRVLHCCWIDEHHGGWNISRLNESMKNKYGMVYHLRFTSKEGKVFDKVGLTTKGLAHRFWATKKLGYTYEVIRICEDNVYNCVLLEHMIKESLKADDRLYRIRDFKHKSIGGWTECFYPIVENEGVEYEETYTSCVI